MIGDPTKQDVQDFGCVVLRGVGRSDGSPYLSVSGGATPNECAQFEITQEGGFMETAEFRFKELYGLSFLGFQFFHFFTK
jgi:hypothetical protein